MSSDVTNQRPVSTPRLIARLDIKYDWVIKGVHLEGFRKVGRPLDLARKYYALGVDELFYMDIVASLYNRNSLSELVEASTEAVFVPLTVGGGIRSIDDAAQLLRSGADKLAVNTAAIRNPRLIEDIAGRFGSQCMVVSIEAKRERDRPSWEALTDNGRNHTGKDVVEWSREAEALGAGEILLTSIDQEGTRSGFDLDLLAAVTAAVRIPVIASGGLGHPRHLTEALLTGGVDAVAVADALHYDRFGLADFQEAAREAGLPLRHVMPQALEEEGSHP